MKIYLWLILNVREVPLIMLFSGSSQRLSKLHSIRSVSNAPIFNYKNENREYTDYIWMLEEVLITTNKNKYKYFCRKNICSITFINGWNKELETGRISFSIWRIWLTAGCCVQKRLPIIWSSSCMTFWQKKIL